ncbi:peptidylprolyl isomerase [Maridesulfovibrio ferrireducens]|uniref:peptidylprolyl isomerase n=1 Tax=Maridesulfovibrio ferrireducens TaxID=246191 RepID=UPI001A1BDE01|nr:peptidylprolyl isomerase [Maridesulfovibrio ferrireducens]MBI9111272.1 peptidyl-prolyl cis-trans isomerase [Maridesulfovibrio ferrireducens]
MKGFKILLVAALFCIALSVGATAKAESSKVFVKMQTSKGNIVLELDRAKAPKSVANFLKYVNEGHYDGTIFHRVISGFMIQGGNMDKNMKSKDTYAPIENEARNGLYNDKYTIAMARTGNPHSATDQFFINTADNGALNFKSTTPSGWGYAVFGKVLGGKKVVDKIERVVTFRKGRYDDVPVKPVMIIKAEEIKQ